MAIATSDFDLLAYLVHASRFFHTGPVRVYYGGGMWTTNGMEVEAHSQPMIEDVVSFD